VRPLLERSSTSSSRLRCWTQWSTTPTGAYRDPGWKKIGSGIIIFILLFAKKKLIVFMFRRLERLMEKMSPEEVAEHPGLGPVCVVSFLAFFSGSAFV